MATSNYQYMRSALESILPLSAVNFLAPARLTSLLLPQLMIQNKSAIVNVTSFLGQAVKQNAAIYCATKAALRSFTLALRYQLEHTTVKVFELIPPVVDTAMTRGRDSQKVSPKLVADSLMSAIEKNELECYVGNLKNIKTIYRLIPRLVEKKVRYS